MAKVFYRLGRTLLGKVKATKIRDQTHWFHDAIESSTAC